MFGGVCRRSIPCPRHREGANCCCAGMCRAQDLHDSILVIPHIHIYRERAGGLGVGAPYLCPAFNLAVPCGVAAEGSHVQDMFPMTFFLFWVQPCRGGGIGAPHTGLHHHRDVRKVVRWTSVKSGVQYRTIHVSVIGLAAVALHHQ